MCMYVCMYIVCEGGWGKGVDGEEGDKRRTLKREEEGW